MAGRTRKKSRHNKGRKPLYKEHSDPAADAKTCEECAGYKPLTGFRRILARGLGPDAYDGICKQCRIKEADRVRAHVPLLDGPKIAPVATVRGFPLLPSAETIATMSDMECEDLFVALRWPDGPHCRRCACDALYVLNGSSHKRWKCKGCEDDFTATSGTPFAGRKASYRIIVTMMSLVQRAKGEVVIRRIATELGVTYKTAYALTVKTVEFLSGETEKESAIKGYWAARSLPKPRTVIAAASLPKACAECGETKPAEDFGLKCGSAGAWGLRVSVCKECLKKRHSALIREAWIERKEADAAIPVIERSASQILAGLRPSWRIFTRAHWSPQEKHDLKVLCAANTPADTASAALSRSASSIAWYAQDMGLTLPKDWRYLIRPQRVVSPRVQLVYPFVPKARPDSADLLRVNDLVPRAFPEHMRADICQSIMLALYEGTLTLADLEANRANFTWFVKKWRKDQTPYQEISLSGGDDERPYDEIAAQLRGEAIYEEINGARRLRDSFWSFSAPIQEDYVYGRELERAHARRHEQGRYLSMAETSAELEAGTEDGTMATVRRSISSPSAR